MVANDYGWRREFFRRNISEFELAERKSLYDAARHPTGGSAQFIVGRLRRSKLENGPKDVVEEQFARAQVQSHPNRSSQVPPSRRSGRRALKEQQIHAN